MPAFSLALSPNPRLNLIHLGIEAFISLLPFTSLRFYTLVPQSHYFVYSSLKLFPIAFLQIRVGQPDPQLYPFTPLWSDEDFVVDAYMPDDYTTFFEVNILRSDI